jgi:hypothetical protein
LATLESSLQRAQRAHSERERVRELGYAVEDLQSLQGELRGQETDRHGLVGLYVSKSAVQAIADSLVRAVEASESYAGNTMHKLVPETVVLTAVDHLRAL